MARDPLDKVRKLLALARSTNVHEAAAAAAQAQALIARYRLDTLIEATEEAEAEPIEEEVLDTTRRSRRWRAVLAAGLAEVNGCIVSTRDLGRERQLVLAGRAADRAAVRSLWGWLAPQLEWLSATHGAGRDRRWHDDFRIGAVETVCARLRAEESAVAEAAAPQALLRLTPALIARKAALARYAAARLTARGGKTLRVDARAWRAGKAAADDLDLP